MAKNVEQEAYDRAAALCLRFPRAEVKLSHGAPSFHVRGKLFAMFSRGGYGEILPALWIKCTHPEQRALVENDPSRYFVPPYVGVSGWVGARLDPSLGSAGNGDVDLAILLENGWAAIAPKKLLNEGAIATAKPRPGANAAKKAAPMKLPMTDAKVSAEALARIRAVCEALPNVETNIDVRHAVFRVGGKPFVYFLDNHHGDAIISVCVRLDLPAIEALIAEKPQRFYFPAYLGKRGWLAIRLDRARVSDKELRGRIEASYAQVLTKPAKPKKR